MARQVSLACSVVLAFALGACALPQPAPDPAFSEIKVTPEPVENPRSVRFEVPTSLIMGVPGGRVPPTLEARIATREIATHELMRKGYCPRGFTGPEGVRFAEGDRSRSMFVVHCVE